MRIQAKLRILKLPHVVDPNILLKMKMKRLNLNPMYIEGEQEEPGIWDFESYENIEMIESWDGCAEDWTFFGSGDTAWTEEES